MIYYSTLDGYGSNISINTAAIPVTLCCSEGSGYESANNIREHTFCQPLEARLFFCLHPRSLTFTGWQTRGMVGFPGHAATVICQSIGGSRGGGGGGGRHRGEENG